MLTFVFRIQSLSTCDDVMAAMDFFTQVALVHLCWLYFGYFFAIDFLISAKKEEDAMAAMVVAVRLFIIKNMVKYPTSTQNFSIF